MEIQNDIKINKSYLYSTVLLMFVLPIISILIDFWLGKQQFYLWMLIGKWFIFWAIGMRLLTAGLKQTITPSFTAQQIFHISDKKSYAIVRELGFANICFGTVGIISLFVPQWRQSESNNQKAIQFKRDDTNGFKSIYFFCYADLCS